MAALAAGPQRHREARRLGDRALRHHHPDATLDTDLVQLFCRCGALHRACQVLDAMPSPSMHAYNVLLEAYPPVASLQLLARLLAAEHRPGRYAMPAALHACGELRDAILGAAFHGFAFQPGLLTNVLVSSEPLDMYAKAGMLDDGMTLRVFDEMPERDSVCCMVTGYARAGRPAEALDLCRRGQVEAMNIENDLHAVPSVRNVCAKEGDLMKGMGDPFDMYAKCGRVDALQAVSAAMKETNVLSWLTLISCYGIYDDMVSIGVKTDCITFTSILSGCSHSGLVSDGRSIFESMGKVHAIEEAVEFIRKMPMESGASVWGALLSACAFHKNLIGCFELEEGNASNYVTLGGIYDAVGRYDYVAGLRSRMWELGMVKTPGCSWVDVKGRACAFHQGSILCFLRRRMLRFRLVTWGYGCFRIRR
ncbi:hypothetical protein SETIT_8G097200v2 [Setaria italica]|uniref:Pentatricopeptide repeat-containing protein n=1 Tax=Setaria italica TaxID=4555 RepID=A0A368S7Q4_SETIT|nr:hypothetical protein SETIT_8G097200v2 [Setaria italica]